MLNFEKKYLPHLVLRSLWEFKNSTINHRVEVEYKSSKEVLYYDTDLPVNIIKFCFRIENPRTDYESVEESILEESNSNKLKDLISESCSDINGFYKALNKFRLKNRSDNYEGKQSLKKIFKKFDFEENELINLYRLTKIESIQTE